MNQRQNHIDNLTHEQMLDLHRLGLISVRVSIQAAMRFVLTNDIVGSQMQLNVGFWRYLAVFINLGAVFGGVISFFYIKWYWSFLIFFGGMALSKMIKNANFAANATMLQRQIFYDPEIYYECLRQGVVLIESRQA